MSSSRIHPALAAALAVPLLFTLAACTTETAPEVGVISDVQSEEFTAVQDAVTAVAPEGSEVAVTQVGDEEVVLTVIVRVTDAESVDAELLDAVIDAAWNGSNKGFDGVRVAFESGYVPVDIAAFLEELEIESGGSAGVFLDAERLTERYGGGE